MSCLREDGSYTCEYVKGFIFILAHNECANPENSIRRAHGNVVFFSCQCTCISQRITRTSSRSVTCLATDACLTAYPGVASSIPVRSHTFVEIDHEMISRVILLPSADSFKKGCCQSVPVFLRTTIATCDLPGGVHPSYPHPSGSAHAM